MSLKECGYIELDTSEGIKGSYNLHKFDPNVEEIWLMQCAKSLNVKQLESQKIKLPGRSAVNDLECISLENAEDEKHYESFGYSNRKGKTTVCRLPIKGTIVVRERINAPQSVGIDELEERCTLAIIAAPHDKTRLRHPLLGHNFKNVSNIHPKIKQRLKKLSEQSRNTSMEVDKRKAIPENGTTQIYDEDVSTDVSLSKKMKKAKANAAIKTKVADDLQWIKNI